MLDSPAGHRIVRFLRLLSDCALRYVYENDLTERKRLFPLILNNAGQLKKLHDMEAEGEELKRGEEHTVFTLAADSSVDGLMLEVNSRACKVNVCREYLRFQDRLAAVVREQEKWKDLAHRLTDEFQKERRRKEALKDRDMHILSTSPEGIFTDVAALDREPQVKTVRKINSNVDTLAVLIRNLSIDKRISTVLDTNLQRKKLTIEDGGEKYADVAEVLTRGEGVMRAAVDLNKGEQKQTKTQLEKVRDTLAIYLEKCKKQREQLRAAVPSEPAKASQ